MAATRASFEELYPGFTSPTGLALDARRIGEQPHVPVWSVLLDTNADNAGRLLGIALRGEVTNPTKLVEEAHSWGFIDWATRQEWLARLGEAK